MKGSVTIQAELLSAMRDTLAAFFSRAAPWHTWGLAAGFVLAVVLVYRLTARACGAQPRSLMVLTPGFFLLLLASAAVRVFWTQQVLPQLFAVLVLFFVLVLPLSCAIQKTSWISSLLLWIVTLLTAAALFYAEAAVSDAVEKGSGSGSLYKKRHGQLDDLFKRSGN